MAALYAVAMVVAMISRTLTGWFTATVWLLVAVDLGFVALNLVVPTGLYSLDQEANLTTWYSSTKLLGLAALAVVLFVTERRRGGGGTGNERLRWPGLWLVAAFLFCALSADETATLHERLASWLMDSSLGATLRDRYLGGDAMKDAFLWPLLFAPLVVIAFVFLVRFFVDRFRLSTSALPLALAGLGMFALALVLETWVARTTPELEGWTRGDLRRYEAFTIAEEAGELAGTTLLVAGFLAYLATLQGAAASRRWWSLAPGALLLTSAAGLTVRAANTPGPPTHVLLVTVDTLRADRLGCYGYPRDTSPALDRLAEDAVVFERAYANGNLSGPQHATLFSSRHQLSHRVRFNGFRLPDQVTTLPEIFRKHGYRTAAFVGYRWVGSDLGMAHRFDEFHQIDVDDRDENGEPGALVLARNWLLDENRDRLFAWVHVQHPHSLYTPPQEYYLPFTGGCVVDSPAELSERVRDQIDRDGTVSPQDAVTLDDLYDGEVRYADRLIGDILDALATRPGADQSVVLVTADHGEILGERSATSFTGHSETLFDQVMHIPLVVRLPGRAHAGRRVATVAQTLDVAPTLLAAAGIGIPDEFQGRNLLPAVEARDPEARDPEPPTAVIAESWHPTYRLRAIRRHPWKLLLAFGDRASELYNLETDPDELDNVLDAHPAIVEELSDELRAVATGATLPVSGRRVVEQLPRPQRTTDPGAIEMLRRGGYLREGETLPR